MQRINALLKDGCFLYGAGTNGQWCLEYCRREHINVLGFIDGNPDILGSFIEEIPVISYAEYAENFRENIVLVTSKHHALEILSEHKDNERMVSFDKWFEHMHTDDYNRLKFEDKRSYDVLDAIRTTMRESDESFLSEVAECNQYFCVAPFFNTGAEAFVDLGACTGDSVERFITMQNGAFRYIYAFEPGERQYGALSARIERLKREWLLEDKKIELVNAGVGRESTEMYLCTSGHVMSDMVKQQKLGDNSIKIKIVKLDDYFKDREVSFLKFDIEGEEYATLEGATDLLKRCRPKMAISVYHRPDDLLRIYRFIEELDMDYKFKLRHHSSLLMETTLYCY